MEALLHDRGNLLGPTWHWKFEARLALKTYISFGTDFSGPMGLGSLRRLWHKSDREHVLESTWHWKPARF